MDGLVERLDGFTYDYRMGCEVCGKATAVTAHDYWSGITSDQPYKACGTCDAPIHVGPPVARIRDVDDLALGDALGEFAWYHTSTWPDWPSPDYADHRAGQLQSIPASGIDLDRVVYTHTHQALHLGTYESAIENMLRRMKNQADGESQFYLFRVGLAVQPGDIEPGYRDETVDPAAQLTTDDLDYPVVRYLNVHEAMGTISLAVRASAIASIQGMAIPINVGASQIPAAQAELDRLETDRVSRLSEAVGADRISLLTEPSTSPTILHATNFLRNEAAYALFPVWQEANSLLADQLLPDVSPVVIDDFVSALSHRRTSTTPVHDYAELFRATASLLTRSPDVIAAVTQQTPRTPAPAESTGPAGDLANRDGEPHTQTW